MSLCIVENCNSEALIGAKKCHYHLHSHDTEHVCKLTPQQVSSLVGLAYHLRYLPEWQRGWMHGEIEVEIERITGSKPESDFSLLHYLCHILGGVLIGTVLGSLFL